MAQITLSRTQVESLVAFCEAAGSERYYVARDRGAFVGYMTGFTPDKQCIFYFKGCDPSKDEDYYENTLLIFDGDDVGIDMDVADLRKALAKPAVKKVRIKVTTRSVVLELLS